MPSLLSLRRALAAIALGAGLSLAAAPGCGGDDERPEDMCGWLADDNSCWARFADDIGLRCGNAFQEGSDPLASATGYFQTRDALDVCLRDKGGQVIFDPPLDLNAFPLAQVSFSILDEQARPCASGSVKDERAYSLFVEPVDTGDPATTISGGTFTVARVEETTSTFDVTCPGGIETHRFNSLQLQKCPSAAPLQPRAVLESSRGVPDTLQTPADESRPGYVRLRLHYPPEGEGAEPRVVEYFSCTIPAPPSPCADGIKNGDETDVDCGGTCATLLGLRCAEGAACVEGKDCESGNCALVQGLKRCAPVDG